MNPLTFVLCALLATGQGPANEAGTVAAVAPQTCQGRHTVLFVGNSRVYYHNQPAMLESLARANGCEVEWRMVVEGGASLASHLQSGEALEVIAKGGWDWVVLNTQSTFGRVHLVDGLERAIAPPPEVFRQLETFSKAIRLAGAEPWIVMHPRKNGAPASDLRTLEAAFRSLQEATDVQVIPVGQAFEEPVVADHDRYDPDGNHPSPFGALLSANAMYASLFGGPPATPLGAIEGPEVEQANGVLHPTTRVELVDASDAQARDAGKAAGEALRRWRSGEGSVVADESAAPPPTFVAADGPLTAEELVGAWSGELRVYPRYLTWPASFALDVSQVGDRLEARFHVSFGGRPPDIVYEHLPVSHEGTYFQLVDPNGPDGGYLRYRIVPINENELRGIAEIITDGDVYGIGGLQLSRVEP